MSRSRFAGQDIGIKKDTLVAATPAEMRGILDDLTTSAIQGKIAPESFGAGVMELKEAGLSPNYTGRNIRNTLKNPFANMLVNNPDMAESMANQSVGLLDQFGIDSKEAQGYIGPGMNLLRQAKTDGLLRVDVTDDEIANKIQKPLYSAIQSYAKDNRNNPEVNNLLQQAYPTMKTGDPNRSNLDVFFSPEKFGH